MPNKKLLIPALISFLVINFCFLGCQQIASLVSADTVKAKVATDFKGDRILLQSGDAFSDCSILLMAAFRGKDEAKNAISPQLPLNPGEPIAPCQILFNYVLNGKPLTYDYEHYTRYWFGVRNFNELAVSILDIPNIKNLCLFLNYFILIIFLALAFKLKRQLGLVFLPLIIYASFFSALPMFGTSISHGPSIFVSYFSGALLLLFAKKWIEKNQYLYMLCVIAGSLITYFDLLSGGILIGVPLVGLVVFNVFKFYKQESLEPALKTAIIAGNITAISIICSELFNLIYNSFFFGVDIVFGQFFSALAFKMENHNEGVATFDEFLNALSFGINTMTFGDADYAFYLCLASAFAWICFLFLSFKKAQFKMKIFIKHDLLLANLGIALFFTLWYLFFRGHTVVHSWFAVRFLYFPLAIGWIGLIQLKLEPHNIPLINNFTDKRHELKNQRARKDRTTV